MVVIINKIIFPTKNYAKWIAATGIAGQQPSPQRCCINNTHKPVTPRMQKSIQKPYGSIINTINIKKAQAFKKRFDENPKYMEGATE